VLAAAMALVVDRAEGGPEGVASVGAGHGGGDNHAATAVASLDLRGDERGEAAPPPESRRFCPNRDRNGQVVPHWSIGSIPPGQNPTERLVLSACQTVAEPVDFAAMNAAEVHSGLFVPALLAKHSESFL
jgi:hypothetical protein